MMETITVTITQEDFSKSSFFSDPDKCPLSNALNRQFGGNEVWRVGIATVRNYEDLGNGSYRYIPNSRKYLIPTSWGRDASEVFTPDEINAMILRAKRGEPIEPVVLTLTLDDGIR
jgi:hypothetical protein